MPRKPKSTSVKSPSAPRKPEKRSAKSKPTPSPKGTRRDEKPSLGEVPISPQILALSRSLKESDITSHQGGRTPSQWAFNKIPPPLLPFVQNPTFENLQQILAHEGGGWWCYSHPIVIEQIRYLVSLPNGEEEEEWGRLGWTYRDYDGVSFPTLHSKYLDLINHALQSLIETQAKGLLPGYCITWKAVKKSGRRKKVWHEPCPGNGEDARIDDQIMYEDIIEFKSFIAKEFGARLKNWRKDKLNDHAVEEIKNIINEGTQYTGPRSGSKRKYIWNPLNLLLPDEEQNGNHWFGPLHYWDIDFHALLKDVTTEINRYRDKEQKSVVMKDGFPAGFTYLFFGYIYDQPPSKIRDFYTRYGSKIRRKRESAS